MLDSWFGRSPRLAAAALAALGVLANASAARAQECAADDDCRPGFVCESFDIELCSAAPCEPGRMCPDPECHTITETLCVNAPCGSNADCPIDMVCYAQPYSECSASASSCAPNEMCAPPEPIECTEHPGEPVCVGRYVPPCEEDADCGPGFLCEEQVVYDCMMPAGMQPQSSGDAMDDDQPIGCEPRSTGAFQCMLQPLPCETHTDCPLGMSCGIGTYSETCTGIGGDDSSWPPVPDSMGMGEPEPCVVMEGPRYCQPDDYHGGPMPGPGGSTSEPGEDMPDGMAIAGSGAPMLPGGEDEEDQADDDGDEHPSWFDRPRRGCSVASEHGESELLGMLGMIGFVALSLRRRARARR